jgi:hypothetical protein
VVGKNQTENLKPLPELLFMKSNVIFGSIVVGIILIAGAAFWHHTAPAGGSPKPLYYTCPMHPSVHADKPGSCPICGMNLEPVYVEAGVTNHP